MTTSIDQQFVEFVVKSLVGNPDAVKIDRRIDEKGVLLELTVDPEDLGRVIGKRGATAQSLRTLLRALGTKNEARYNLKIVDVDRLDENGNPLPAPAKKRNDNDDTRSDSDDDASQSMFAGAQKTDDDGADNDDSSSAPTNSRQSDVAARTRAELADLDDLDI
jgi:predicted RNA-binding protein YlqC (UPF0109 family)